MPASYNLTPTQRTAVVLDIGDGLQPRPRDCCPSEAAFARTQCALPVLF